MAPHPKTPKDLLLAPVAAEIDFNLQSLRDKSPGEIDEAVAIVLNVDTAGTDRATPGGRVQSPQARTSTSST